MFAYTNSPEISHLVLIVDHLGHMFSEGEHSETFLKSELLKILYNKIKKGNPAKINDLIPSKWHIMTENPPTTTYMPSK